MMHAVILNQDQAKILVSHGPKPPLAVLSFCPSASYYLKERGYQVSATAGHYRALSHGRVVVAVARELPRIRDAAVRQYGLDDIMAEGLGVYLYHDLCCVYHLHFAMRHMRHQAERFLWVDGSRLMQGDYETMFASLAAQPSRAILAYAYTRYSWLHYLLASAYNAVICACVTRIKRPKVLDYGDELPKKFTKAMLEAGQNPVLLHTHTLGKNAYKTTRFFIKSLRALMHRKASVDCPVYLFRVARPSDYRASVVACELPTLHAPIVRRAVKQRIEALIPFFCTEVAMGRRLVMRAGVDLAVSDHAKYAYILGGLEVLHQRGGTHWMLNHGTHTMQYDRLSALASSLWGAQGRIVNRHTTDVFPKSPLTAALAEHLRPSVTYRLHKINVYGRIHNQASREGKLVILQAGNYTDAMNHIPWCKETADEYLLAIMELLEEVRHLENVELIIKLKQKKSKTHQKIVEEHIARLGIGDKARVDTTSKFSDLMARAHLVVCNLSGTIEEALANNIPLMLHSARKTYFHIPEKIAAASTIDGMAPVYLVHERADIVRILRHVDAHRTRLNDPALYRQVAWQAEELESLASVVR